MPSNPNRARAVVATAALVFSSSVFSAGQACEATAELSSDTVDAIGQYSIEFYIAPKNCGAKCSGAVHFDLIYRDKRGKTMKTRGLRAPWKSSNGSEETIKRAGFETFCSPMSLGPCELVEVKMFNTTCTVIDD